MNSRYIKIIALLTMTLDHIGYLLFPNIELFRIFGRLSMPLFAFLIAYGATKTKNIHKYFIRLFTFAIAIQTPFEIFNTGLDLWNIFFTLSLGVLTIIFIQRYKLWLSVPMCAAVLLCSYTLPIDYGIHGVFLILMFYVALKHSLGMLKITCIFSIALFNFISALQFWWGLQWFSLFAAIFIVLFKDQKLKIGKTEKWAFYIYYPLHFLVIYSLSFLL